MSAEELMFNSFVGNSTEGVLQSGAVGSQVQRLEKSNAELQNKVMLYQKDENELSHSSGFEAWLRNHQAQTMTSNDIASVYGVHTNTLVPLPKMTVPTALLQTNGAASSSLTVVEQPLPSALNAREALVNWLACPITPNDLHLLQNPVVAGHPIKMPTPFGNEGIGFVSKVGEGCSLQAGDLVLPSKMCSGTWRESAVYKESDLFKMSASSVHSDAMAHMHSIVMAYQLLRQEVIKPGDTIVQADAGSAVGQAVIQICRVLKVNSISLIPDTENFAEIAQQLEMLGADLVLPLSTDSIPKILRGSNVARPRLGLLNTGGVAWNVMSSVVRDGCTVCFYGCKDKCMDMLPMPELLFRGIKITGFWYPTWVEANRESVTEAIDMLLPLMEDGKLQIIHQKWQQMKDSLNAALAEAQSGSMPVLLHFQSLDDMQNIYSKQLVAEQKASVLKDWLDAVALGEYHDLFVDKGYTDLETIKEMGITDEDLDFLGIHAPIHRRKLIQHSTPH
eukprot:TRINITY_DN17759_c0_g2_i4.p1 TRINITY_DN17759_c0_g2~~TRINITY_DN17759_c0_g2_i4.p1  ORF type:complete len:505 (+),score=141.13 TRINITY_DN17759_c0_g2_i4:185-1699(+)